MTGEDNWHFDRDTRFSLKRDRLLRAAAECFNRKGYSGTSLKDVAQRLGLTDAALYYYVRSKEELVYRCYLRAAQVGAEAMARGREEGDSGLDKALRYLGHHIDAMCGDEGPMAIMSEIPSLSDAHKADILKRSREHSLDFEALLAEGINDGSIAPCDVRMTGNAIMGAINWIPKWYRPDGSAQREQIRTQFIDFFRRGLAPSDPALAADAAPVSDIADPAAGPVAGRSSAARS